MPTTQQEKLTPELWAEMLPLFQRNADAAHFNYPLKLDYDALLPLPLVVWTLRVGGKLAGYTCHMVVIHPLFQNKWACSFAVFLEKRYRSHARRHFLNIEQDLIEMGVCKITYACPHLTSMAPFLETRRMGYKCEEIVMGKEL